MKPCNHINYIDGCRLCWLYKNNQKYRDLWDKIEKPTIVDKAENFISAIVKHIKLGLPVLSDEDTKKRLDICKSCEMYENNKCKLCGCNLSLKAKMASTTCPYPTGSKWPDITQSK